MPTDAVPLALLAGVARNVAPFLSYVRRDWEAFAACVPQARCVIYENNSSDATPSLLAAWAAEDPRVHVVSERLDAEAQLAACRARTWDNRPCRIECIAAARNRLQEMLEAPAYDAYAYVVLRDLDNWNPMPTEAIVARLKAAPARPFDALINNGIDEYGCTYDFFSYRDDEVPYGPEILGENFWRGEYPNNGYRKNTDADWRPVVSAFNGLAILRKEAMRGLRYSAVPTAAVDAYYRTRRARLPHLSPRWPQPPLGPPHTHHEGALLGAFLHGPDGMFYYANSGFNFPVLCEHVPFFVAMRARGHDRIYLDPHLQWSWVRKDYNTPKEFLAGASRPRSPLPLGT